MRKFISWLGKWLPIAWSLMWIVAITAASGAVSVLCIRWLLTLLGVL